MRMKNCLFLTNSVVLLTSCKGLPQLKQQLEEIQNSFEAS